jgi:outer membrane lipoprotein-sorting protein
MRPAKIIEKQIKNLRYDSNAETHRRVFDNVLQAMDKHENLKSGATAPGVWRIIMKSLITKFAAAAVIIIAALVIVNQLGIPVETSAFAQVAGRLRMARTLTYKITTHSTIDMEMEMSFKEPGYVRMEMPGGYVAVADYIQGKAINILPVQKQYLVTDLTLTNDSRQQFDVIENLRTLPERADAILGTIEDNGRILQGYRVTQNGMIDTVWIDDQTRELVRIEVEFINAPGMSAEMTDFRYDVDLEDSLFDLTPPEGYSRMDNQFNTSEIIEQDLIEFLQMWTSWTKDKLFPPTLNPMELPNAVMEMIKQKKLVSDETFGQTEGEPAQESLQQMYQKTLEISLITTRGLMFVLQLPAESNWQYAGENVQFGDAETPIFWYKPAGSQMYRIIYGDLTVKDVAPEDLPQ